MSRKRNHISFETKLAATLLQLKRGDGSLFIPPEHRSKSAREIVRLVQWDHMTPHAIGGSDHPSNLQPLMKREHLEKTKRDVKAIAKGKRLQKKQAAHKQRMDEKAGLAVAVEAMNAVVLRGAREVPQRKGRPFPGSKASPFKRKMNGNVEIRA